MRLSLHVSPPWVPGPALGSWRVAVLPGDGRPVASLSYGPLVLRPDDLLPWIESSARGEIPRGSRVRLGASTEIETETGWALRLVEAEVLGPQGELIESRLCAFYAFLEHAAVAIVRIPDRSQIEGLRGSLIALLRSGRPDWRAEPISLADAWDLQPQPDRIVQRKPLPVDPIRPIGNDQPPVSPDAAPLTSPGAPAWVALFNHARRLLAQKQPTEALSALQQARALSDPSASTHYLTGLALDALGRPDDAVVEWQAAIKLQPTHLDAICHLARARFHQREFAQALSDFRCALALAPGDVPIQRGLIQSLYALGRYDEGEAARQRLRESLLSSTDPRTRFIEEYVFDQLAGSGFFVQASETVRPRDPSFFALLRFRAYDAAERPLPASVVVETSDLAKQAGTPFVLAVQTGPQFRIIGSAKTLPPYAALKQTVLDLLGQSLNAGQSEPSAR